jgi:xanthine dehydrogenase YagR molybdenum-binding subunit
VTAGIVAPLFGLETADVRVITDFVGGGFGSKLVPNPPTILAVLAAKVTRRPVKIALTRQQMFTLIPHRTPTIQRVRLGATLDGRLTAIDHDALQHCSILAEYCEQTVTGTRVMYPAPAMRTVHRLARLNVPPPAWMRAPGEAPGMFALESAMDELAVKLAMDPVELRIRNDTSAEPASGLPFSSRSLARCLREGARRFGWADRDPKPGARRDGRWLTGTGVASATYPVYLAGSSASARADADGTFTIRIAAVDIGTGARTALAQIAATALRVPVEQVRLELGHSDMPAAPWAGGSLGTASWGWAVTRACEALLRDIRERDGAVPAAGLEAVADTTAELERQRRYARHSFGAHFAQVRVDSVTGTVRLDRLLGVFAAGRIINPRLARSQLLGGMIMGASTALHEALELDPQDGDYANHDLASYHFAAHADIQGVEAVILEENDFDVNLLGVKGVGELGIVGTAAAIANAVYHATGTRVRDLPLTLERTCPVER